MKQKMKKLLCLVMSFVFLLSNSQLFAQEKRAAKKFVKYFMEKTGIVPLLDMPPEAYKPLEDAYIEQLGADLAEVRKNLEALKTNVSKLFAEKDINKIRDIINPEIVRLQKEIEGPYITLFGDIHKLNDYITADIETEPMERLAREYVRKHPLPKPTPSIAEGVVFYKMKKNINNVLSIYEEKGVVANKEIVLSESEINTILYEMEARLRYAENNMVQLVEGNEQIY
ncbi:MAG: hypothetical protein J6S61_05810, partial [Elusimicrobiaceae bacterium]|nr:hypothetical protein [Elusimicrobiaceae bacterium]